MMAATDAHDDEWTHVRIVPHYPIQPLRHVSRMDVFRFMDIMRECFGGRLPSVN